ncbi:hypothetical protein SHLA_25c000140 [Shinella sp. DD12]|nr:hypothetical protein SHLA_25c000140 [Shinella sp. DD12]
MPRATGRAWSRYRTSIESGCSALRSLRIAGRTGTMRSCGCSSGSRRPLWPTPRKTRRSPWKSRRKIRQTLCPTSRSVRLKNQGLMSYPRRRPTLRLHRVRRCQQKCDAKQPFECREKTALVCFPEIRLQIEAERFLRNHDGRCKRSRPSAMRSIRPGRIDRRRMRPGQFQIPPCCRAHVGLISVLKSTRSILLVLLAALIRCSISDWRKENLD